VKQGKDGRRSPPRLWWCDAETQGSYRRWLSASPALISCVCECHGFCSFTGNESKIFLNTKYSTPSAIIIKVPVMSMPKYNSTQGNLDRHRGTDESNVFGIRVTDHALEHVLVEAGDAVIVGIIWIESIDFSN
jgi:hypothetical protein